MWRKGNPFALLVGMQTSAATVKTVWRFLKKFKMFVIGLMVTERDGLGWRKHDTIYR